MPTEIAGPDRAEDRIRDRMQKCIPIRMAFETAIVRNLDPPEYEGPAGDQPMDVDALPDSHDPLLPSIRRDGIADTSASAVTRSSGRVIFGFG